MDRLLAAAFALLLSAVPSQLFGEGEATRITIQSLYLKAPIEIVDPVILSTFNVWTGPGTWSSDPAFNENAPGFIIDWSCGAIPAQRMTVRRPNCSSRSTPGSCGALP